MQKNPYDILGVRENDSLQHINKVYKDLMLLLHPDKANTSLDMSIDEKITFMNLIRKAYKDIIKKESDYPDYNLDYKVDENVKITKPDTFNEAKFNEIFFQAAIDDKKAGMEDPFTRGYDEFSKDKNFGRSDKVTASSYTSIPTKTPTLFVRPEMKDNRIVEYLPEAIPLSNSNVSHQELGLTNISDFSMSTSGKGGLHGSDLNAVYGQNLEYWEDTVKRDAVLSAKFSDTISVNKKFTGLEAERGHIYDLPIDQNILKAENEHNKSISDTIQQRKSRLNTRDDYYNSLNRGQISM